MDDMTLAKPAHGAPCNGCGYCCEAELCIVASSLLNKPLLPGNPGPCPYLEKDGEKRVCGLVVNPTKHAPLVVMRVGAAKASEHAAALVGTGIGCDAQSIDEPENKAFRKKLLDHKTKHGVTFSHGVNTWIVRGRNPLQAMF